MLRIQIAVIMSLVILGATKVLTAPTVVTYKIALPHVESIDAGVMVAFDNNDPEPRWIVAPASITNEDRECLAQNIYFEAKNQSVRGQLAVGIVTLKRVSSSRFPDSICGVVKHTFHATTAGFPILNKCQFSWYCDGRSDRPFDETAYLQALSVAGALLSKESVFEDFTGGADHYHADYIEPPYWTDSMMKVATIDNHIFYRTASL